MADTNLLLRPEAASDSPVIRTLPANIEAEAAFLGAVLIDNRVLEDMATPLRAQHFFEPVHQRVFDRIVTLLDRNAHVSPVTLKPYFEADEALKELGGITYLARLTADGQGLLAPRELAEQIYDLALLRELVSVGRNLVESALDTSETVAPLEQIEQAESALYKVAEGAGAAAFAAGADCAYASGIVKASSAATRTAPRNIRFSIDPPSLGFFEPARRLSAHVRVFPRLRKRD